MLGTKNAVDTGKFVGRELKVVQSGNVLLNLLDAACADKYTGHVRISQNPSQSELSDGLPARLCHVVKRANFRQNLFCYLAFLEESIRESAGMPVK